MLIFPAIDLYEGKAVRLYKGDYAQMTTYSVHPTEVAKAFAAEGAKHLHIVDLEGAKTGQTPNLAAVLELTRFSGLFCEVGGGVRSLDTVARYLDAGVDRVILGTAAVTDPGFVEKAVARYGAQIAVGVDVRNGLVAVKGWTEDTGLTLLDFCESMQAVGVNTFICTDIAKDGAMRGANRTMYQTLSGRFPDAQLIASGGVSTLGDVKALAALGLYGAIIGKAYYTGAIRLSEAIEVAK